MSETEFDDEVFYSRLYARAIKLLLQNNTAIYLKHPHSGDGFTITKSNNVIWTEGALIEDIDDGTVFNVDPADSDS